jgi:hypothetical protein
MDGGAPMIPSSTSSGSWTSSGGETSRLSAEPLVNWVWPGNELEELFALDARDKEEDRGV